MTLLPRPVLDINCGEKKYIWWPDASKYFCAPLEWPGAGGGMQVCPPDSHLDLGNMQQGVERRITNR